MNGKDGTHDQKYLWTRHAHDKMGYYRLTESRVRRIIRYPARVEEGICEGAVAAMQPAGAKKYSEIWVMYVLVKADSSDPALLQTVKKTGNASILRSLLSREKKVKIITAWRYPGVSPRHNPIPQDILDEIRNIL